MKKGAIKRWRYNDGGRLLAGKVGIAHCSVVRAITIATGMPYQQVFDELKSENALYSTLWHHAGARKLLKRGPDPELGVLQSIYKRYLLRLGWVYFQTPQIMLKDIDSKFIYQQSLSTKTAIISAGNRLTVLKRGTFYDTVNPLLDTKRIVKGYYTKEW